MSVNYAVHESFSKLSSIESWSRKTRMNSAMGVTKNDTYYSGMIESQTHLLDITPEEGVLALAVTAMDPHVHKVVTITDEEIVPNPYTIKVLVDHVRRTGTRLSYTVLDTEGKERFHCDDVYNLYYKPPIKPLEKIAGWTKRVPIVEGNIEGLYECAKRGTETHFSSGTASKYGAAMLVEGKIYYGGNYSSFDHKNTLHAEMVAMINVLAAGKQNIEAVGIVSNKFMDEPVKMCGCCCQFLMEIEQRTGMPITVYAFSFDGTQQEKMLLKELLPNAWYSKRPLREL